MNCDNIEFMFAQDFVSCALQKFNPRWSKPPGFGFGTENGSPFTSDFREALEFIIERKHQAYESSVHSYIEGAGIYNSYGFYTTAYHILNNNYPSAPIEEQLENFITVTAAASFFFDHGVPSDYHVSAANLISKYIFKRRKDGLIGETIWLDYEATTLDMMRDLVLNNE